MSEYAVKVKDLSKKFGAFQAVDKISFEVPRGMVFGFLGPNGAGKSTTIRMLCGILSPTSGEGFVGGYNIFKESEKIKSIIGYMSQKFSLYEDLTVEENLDFYCGIYGVSTAHAKKSKEWAIKMSGLEENRSRRCQKLSGGWKQRLALGCAVLHEPSILFLDEPTSGVDPNSRRRFWNLIYELSSQGVTVFVTTHYMDEAEYFDKIAFIYQGKLIAQGTPDSLKRETMKEAVIDIRTENAQDFMEEIRAITGVKEVALFGQGLHVTAKDPEAMLIEIDRFFEAKNLTPQKRGVILPTLEDVFVSLIETWDGKQ